MHNKGHSIWESATLIYRVNCLSVLAIINYPSFLFRYHLDRPGYLFISHSIVSLNFVEVSWGEELLGFV